MVEVLVCVLLLGMLAAVSAAFLPATRGAAAVRSDLVTLNHARAKMEELRAGPAAALTGSDTLVVRGEPVPRSWAVTVQDLDGDGEPEADAFLLHVQMGLVRLETLRTEPAGLTSIKR